MATSVNTSARRNDYPQRTDFKTKTERGWDEVCTSARAIFSANGHTFSKNRANENSPKAAHLPCLKMTGCLSAIAPSKIVSLQHVMLC